MIDLNDVAKYLSSVKAQDVPAGSTSTNEIQSVVCELQESIRNDEVSAALLGPATAQQTKGQAQTGRRFQYLLTPFRLSILSLMAMGAVVLFAGAARRNSIRFERQQLEPLCDRMLMLSHSIEDNVDALGELETMLRYVDTNRFKYQENRDTWISLRVGLRSIIVLEQAKRGRFDEAILLSQSAVEESQTLPEDAVQKIPSHSLAHYAYARALYDKGRRQTGDERFSLLRAAASESRQALNWIERGESLDRGASFNTIVVTYHARLLALDAVIAHKQGERERALARYQQAFQRINQVPETGRDSSWHLTISRIYADQGMTFSSEHLETSALESLDKGLAALEREDPFDAAWMRGLIQSNRADLFQITGDNSGEIAARHQAIDYLRQAIHRSGITASIEENLILNYARLALAYLRIDDSKQAEVTIHRLQGLSEMEMPYHQMGYGDRARVAVMIASDPYLSPDKRAVQLRLLQESLEAMRLASAKWPKENVATEARMWNSLTPYLETLPAEIQQQVKDLFAER